MAPQMRCFGNGDFPSWKNFSLGACGGCVGTHILYIHIYVHIYIHTCISIYIYTLEAPGFRKGWGGVGHVNVKFMVR